MVSTLGDASLEDVTLVTQPLFGAPQREVELREVLATDVAQLATFQVVPDPFDGVEIRRVAWKLLQMDPLGGSLDQEVFDRLAAVNGGPIPDDEEFAAHLAQEQAQETDHLGTVIGPRLGLQEEAPVAAEGADGRAMISGEGDAQHGRLPTARPGPHVMREQIEPRLVYPDKTPLLVVGFFLSAGQRCSHQPRMAASSRCVARSMGRCTR